MPGYQFDPAQKQPLFTETWHTMAYNGCTPSSFCIASQNFESLQIHCSTQKREIIWEAFTGCIRVGGNSNYQEIRLSSDIIDTNIVTDLGRASGCPRKLRKFP